MTHEMTHDEAIYYMRSTRARVRECIRVTDNNNFDYSDYDYSTFWFNEHNVLECDDYGISPWDEFGKCQCFQTYSPNTSEEFVKNYLQEADAMFAFPTAETLFQFVKKHQIYARQIIEESNVKN